jgi:hypothetical protein
MQGPEARVGIASLQRQPLDVESWMKYHRNVGILFFYFWFEDCPEQLPLVYGLGEKLGAVVYAELGPTVDRSREDNYFDLMTRQSSFVNRMIRKARIDGVEWLFHIDDDELFFVHDGIKAGLALARVPQSYDTVHFNNWEGFAPKAVNGSWYTDRGVKYLPASCANSFSAYSNGKSVTRTRPAQRFNGPHHFTGREYHFPEDIAVVLHHDGLPMSKTDMPPKLWLRKNQLRLTSNLAKIPFKSTHDAVQALLSGNKAAVLEAWKKHRSQEGAMFKKCNNAKSLPLLSYEF